MIQESCKELFEAISLVAGQTRYQRFRNICGMPGGAIRVPGVAPQAGHEALHSQPYYVDRTTFLTTNLSANVTTLRNVNR